MGVQLCAVKIIKACTRRCIRCGTTARVWLIIRRSRETVVPNFDFFLRSLCDLCVFGGEIGL